MTQTSAIVSKTMRVATVHGQESHQTMPAIDQDRHQSHLSCTIVKYVKSAVLVPRYDACVNEPNSYEC